jgi:hypothetical protein
MAAQNETGALWTLRVPGADDYKSRAARDARDANYGDPSYWEYLDAHAERLRNHYRAHPEAGIDPDDMMRRTLTDALAGNDGP